MKKIFTEPILGDVWLYIVTRRQKFFLTKFLPFFKMGDRENAWNYLLPIFYLQFSFWNCSSILPVFYLEFSYSILSYSIIHSCLQLLLFLSTSKAWNEGGRTFDQNYNAKCFYLIWTCSDDCNIEWQMKIDLVFLHLITRASTAPITEYCTLIDMTRVLLTRSWFLIQPIKLVTWVLERREIDNTFKTRYFNFS